MHRLKVLIIAVVVLIQCCWFVPIFIASSILGLGQPRLPSAPVMFALVFAPSLVAAAIAAYVHLLRRIYRIADVHFRPGRPGLYTLVLGVTALATVAVVFTACYLPWVLFQPDTLYVVDLQSREVKPIHAARGGYIRVTGAIDGTPSFHIEDAVGRKTETLVLSPDGTVSTLRKSDGAVRSPLSRPDSSSDHIDAYYASTREGPGGPPLGWLSSQRLLVSRDNYAQTLTALSSGNLTETDFSKRLTPREFTLIEHNMALHTCIEFVKFTVDIHQSDGDENVYAYVAISPDRQRIAFINCSSGNTRIEAYDFLTGMRNDLVQLEPGTTCDCLTWSMDSRLLAWRTSVRRTLRGTEIRDSRSIDWLDLECTQMHDGPQADISRACRTLSFVSATKLAWIDGGVKESLRIFDTANPNVPVVSIPLQEMVTDFIPMDETHVVVRRAP